MNFNLFTSDVIVYFLIFCRVGMAMTLLPAFSATYITPRTRLFFAVALSLIIGSIYGEKFSVEVNNTPVGIMIAIFSETIVGFMIGAFARIISSAINVAGMIISMQSALAQATLFDPNQASQGAIFGNFMELMAIVMMFALNLHHLLILALANSYSIYPLMHLPDFDQLADNAALLFSKSFLVAFQLSSPFIVIGLITNLASGILSRLMPSFQVFFVITPAQIMVSFFLFAATLSSIIMWYMNYLNDSFSEFLQ